MEIASQNHIYAFFPFFIECFNFFFFFVTFYISFVPNLNIKGFVLKMTVTLADRLHLFPGTNDEEETSNAS